MIRANTIPNLHKIAVLRANALGDLIFALPALDALRSTYPDAEIVLLATDWHRAFLADRPGPVDRVVVVPPSRGVSRAPHEEDDPAALESFFADMHKERFDLAIQLHGGGRFSNPFVRRLHARLTAGLCAADAEPLDLSVAYVYFQSEILRYMEVVGLVGARTDRLEPRIAVTAHDRAEAAAVLPEDGQPIVVLHAGAGDPRRRWPAEKFSQVGDALARAGYRIVLTGAPWERDSARQIQAMMHAEAVDVAGRTSLGALAGLLGRAAVVVSNDSGPLHLARAVDTPTVGLYWCGNLITASPPFLARHRPLISWQLDCPVCGQSIIHAPCDHRVSFVAEIRVEDVIAAAFSLVEADRRVRPRQGTALSDG
jgi:ADP-heptose:LPS heptosyltransferase